MTQHLLLKSFTPAGGQSPQDVGTINVFVGPNNSGKSEALRDLSRLAGNFEPTGEERVTGDEPKTRVIQDVAFVSKLSMDRLLRGMTLVDTGGQEGKVAQGIGPDLRSPYRRTVAIDLKNILFRPIITARSVWMTSLGDLMPLRVAYLPAEQRSRLIEPAAATSPLKAPEHLLAALQSADAGLSEQFDKAFSAMFDGMHVYLDATERVQLSLRVAATLPTLTGNAIQDAQTISRLRPLQSEGSGMTNCAAIILTMLLCQGRVILLDQPDAGLQPEASRRLAAWIAENAAPLGCQVFVTTRDPAFLSGLYSANTDVAIWRLTRKEDITRFEAVPAEVGKAFATFPLFVSQRGIECLWREGVIVTPDSADAVVYQTVAERLLRIHNVGFLQAHGGRNLTFVVKALRRANLPTCVVSELDLFQTEAGFTELVKSLSNNPPPAPWLSTRERLVSHIEGWFDAAALTTDSNELESFLDQFKQGSDAPAESEPAATNSNHRAKWDRLRRERLTILPPELRVWVEELLEDLKRLGLFVSPKGRLEGWIAFTTDAEDPDGWLNRAMQMLHAGECPAELRAFVAEMTAQIKASVTASRSTRSNHRA